MKDLQVVNSRPLALAVDDEAVTRAVIRSILEHNRCAVTFASSAEEAKKGMQEAPPDLLLLDAMMPGMSGYEFCRTIKAESRYRNIPVVFLTGRDSAEIYRKGTRPGPRCICPSRFEKTAC